jgi:phosphate starvation-inducible PhoH-like protein
MKRRRFDIRCILMSETTISVFDSKSLLALFGPRDQHVRKLREALGVSISARDGRVYIEGATAAVATASSILE